MPYWNSLLARDTAFGFLDAATQSEQLLNPLLIANNDEDKMLYAIREELTHASHFTFSVAFISSRGIALLKEALLQYQGTGEIITSNYLDFNEPAVFRELLLLQNVNVFIHDDVDRGFHPKGYIFRRDDSVTAIVGSSNLTDNALLVNQEWNLRFSYFLDGDIAIQLEDAVRRQKARSSTLTEEWISHYEKNRQVRPILVPGGDSLPDTATEGRIYPNKMQVRALESLQELRDLGENKAVIISATGTGKTILAALAVRAAEPKRFLFLVHREQILNKAISEFQRVLEDDSDQFGKFVGRTRQTERKYLFSTVQSLSQEGSLEEFTPDAFDYIIIDEVHRAGADTYRRIVDHFSPSFLLGLTATPERTDGFNIFELFDYNVPFEIRLHEALEEKMLVPFHYYGVTDFINAERETIEDAAQLRHLVAEERVKHVLEMLRRYGHPTGVKGLIFCSRKDEAHELSSWFNHSSINGKFLRAKVLTGEDPAEQRELVIQELENGLIDYILTVDIFNEGIDIPPVNQVVMLRETQSSIIFTQQLGRGLRKAPGKDHLRVIDFIGNYKNNYLIPIALFGDNSRNKDSIRKNLLDSNSTNTIAGVSSVNFDAISQQRILDSLAKAQLIGKRIFKNDIQKLKNRLGRLPRLFDFARFDMVDPVLLASKYEKKSSPKNYWQLLKDLKFVDQAPTAEEASILAFLSSELLSGKRPHEILLLRELLEKNTVTREDFSRLLKDKGCNSDDVTLSSVERILALSFYTSADIEKFGGSPMIEISGWDYRLNSRFRSLYEASVEGSRSPAESFKEHVDDLLETALFLSREFGYWSGDLKKGAKYSRREVCRLLNWQNNHESTMYGYKRDEFTSTCPIFVTYHKAEEVSDSTKYKDAFTSPQVMHWFSKNNRTLESNELQPIIHNEVDLHLFVKKDDSEGTDFYYLGRVESQNQKDEQMAISGREPKNVVTMDLNLLSPVEKSLYDYLTTGVSSEVS